MAPRNNFLHMGENAIERRRHPRRLVCTDDGTTSGPTGRLISVPEEKGSVTMCACVPASNESAGNAGRLKHHRASTRFK